MEAAVFVMAIFEAGFACGYIVRRGCRYVGAVFASATQIAAWQVNGDP